MQDALFQLRDASKEKTLLTQQLHQKEKDVKQLEQALSQLREGAVEKDNQIIKLKDALEKNKKEAQVWNIAVSGLMIYEWC